MSKLMERIFHGRRHPDVAPDEAVVEAVTSAAPVSAGLCDICNTDLAAGQGRTMPASEFRRVVEQGYNPFATGRASGAASMLAASMGVDPYSGWRQMAISSTTAWALCGECAKDVDAFTAQH